MRKTIFLSLALAAVLAACGDTPSEPESRAQAGSTIQADGIEGDTTAARGGNLMGSGH
jgi:ABC-type glycerol-3-phosphate transport system substrate-binding protein